MKRLAFGAAAAGGAALALHHLAPRLRELHTHCREMRHHCGSAACQPQRTPRRA